MSKDDELVRTQVRFPSALYALLGDAAKAAGRSINAELVHRLQGSFSENVEIPSFILDSVREVADARGRSLSAEVVSRLEWSLDSMIGWLEEALEPVRDEIVKEAHRLEWPIKQAIEHRLKQYRPTLLYGVQLEIKTEVELSTSAILAFLSAVSGKLDLRRVEKIEVRVFPPANSAAGDKPAPIYFDQLDDYSRDEVFGPDAGEQRDSQGR